MNDQKELDLIIRAQLKGGRSIESITRSIKDLEEAIDSQAAAAKRGESAYDGLKAAAAGLKAVQEELGARGRALKNLQDLTKRLDEQTAAVDKARDALKLYEAANAGDRTAAQQARVQKLTETYERAQKRLASTTQSVEVLQAALKAAGEDTSNLGEAQRRVADQQLNAATAQNRLNDELVQYSTNIAKARTATADKAKADAELARQQELLSRLQQGNTNDAKLGVQQQIERTKRLEQAEADRLATLLKLGKAQRDAAGRAAAGSELASIADSDQFVRDRAAKSESDRVRDAGFKQQADEAQKAAQAYVTLATASQNLRPKVISLRDAVDELINPSAKARESLEGVEKQVTELAAKIAANKGPVKDYAEQFKDLTAAQKALAGQASLIDQFAKQKTLVKEAGDELRKARQEVAQYTTSLRAGGEGAQAFVKPLAEAQTRLRAVAQAFRDQSSSLAQTRDLLKAAGVDTNNLVGAQDRILASTKQATTAIKQLGDAYARHGEEVKKSGKGFSLFRDEGRTTLSLTQRLRGEILALTASYLGVQGAINIAVDSLKAFNENTALRSTLGFALGDTQKVGEEIAYVADQAERLGISFAETSKAYAKFAAAGIKSGASIKEVREIFEAFAETGRVIGLTPDQLNGIFNALGQSFSKGKIQAEELRQQIGERLPGAFAFAQEALKGLFPDLNKALEEGKVGAENLLLIAQSVRKAAEGQLPNAIKTLDAEQQRFNNSVLFFKQQIAEAGFADAYIALLKELTTYFRSEDGKKFAQQLGGVAKAFVEAAALAFKFRDEFALIIGLLGAAVAGNLLFKTAVGITAIGTSAQFASLQMALMSNVSLTLAGGIGALASVLLRLTAAVVGVGLAAFQIGSYLYDQFPIVRKFGVLLIATFDEMFVRIKFATLEFFHDFPRIAENAFKEVINSLTQFYRTFLKIFQVGANALGLTGFAESIGKGIDALLLKPNEAVNSRVAALRKEREDEIAKIKALTKDMLADIDNPAKVAARVAPGTTTGTTPRGGKGGPSAEDIAKRAKELEALTNALEGIEARALKKQGDTLQSQLAAIDKEFADLERRIQKLGGKEEPIFLQRFRDGIAALKAEVTTDFNNKLLKSQTDLAAKLDQVEATAGKKQKDELQARLQAIETQYRSTYEEIARLQVALQSNGRDTQPAADAKARLDAAVLELQNLEKIKFLKEQLQAQERGINDLLNARRLAIEAVTQEEAAGAVGKFEAERQIQAIIQQYQPLIDQATQKALTFAEANRAAFDPAALQEFINKLKAAQTGAGELSLKFNSVQRAIDQGIGTGVSNAFNTLYDDLGRLIDQTGDWGDVFDNIGKSILRMVADILKEIAALIIKQQILTALRSAGVVAGVAHSGGVVGHTMNRSRAISPHWFANAPRYHNGGLPGLGMNEVPIIAKRNEEVLSESDPRNILNGGLSAGGKQPERAQRFILVDDQRSAVAEALATPPGEEAVMATMKKNIPTLRQWLKK